MASFRCVFDVMSEEKLKSFLAAVQLDPVLLKKLQDIEDPEAIVNLAKEYGFELSLDFAGNSRKIVSDSHLEGISGGTRGGTSVADGCNDNS